MERLYSIVPEQVVQYVTYKSYLNTRDLAWGKEMYSKL
jgi:hypothetical protein